MRTGRWGGVSFGRGVATTLVSALAACGPPDPSGDAASGARPTFVGSAACAECHPDETSRWRGSHHDLAMQVATPETVLGDFEDARFSHFGVDSIFFRRGDVVGVRTEGADGEPADFGIAYTFGVDPLQQYLVGFPDGRLQALGIAWDARSESAGGQRWFALYPDRPIRPGDPLHWTGVDQTWNFMCASCHSTGVRKRYDPVADRYDTTYEEIDVGCEACHGPGSAHVEQASAARGSPAVDARGGLIVDLARYDPSAWKILPDRPNAQREGADRRAEVAVCARCHSRRSALVEEDAPDRPLLDVFRPALLDEGLYHPDGQILEEVYVWGSFIQSRMHAAGVVCSDCHESHGLELRAQGNDLCARCHRAERFDRVEHHHHPPASPGSACVECHMESRTYMVLDARRDHSFRVPRPDLSLRIGTPNACDDCHADRGTAWAADRVADWYGPLRRSGLHFGDALALGRAGGPGAEAALADVAGDPTTPAIARATAVRLLGEHVGPGSVDLLLRASGDRDPLVRMAAAGSIEALAPEGRVSIGRALLDDPVRAVRVESARSLASVPREALSAAELDALARGIEEYRAVQQLNADRPEARLSLGVLEQTLGRPEAARREYERALAIDPTFVAAHVNLADLFRILGRDDEGERILRRGLEVEPRNPDLHHVLGLLLVRRQRLPEALEALRWAVSLDPDRVRFAYVYGVALNATGEPGRAISVLERALVLHPEDPELLYAAATIARDAGERTRAADFARRLGESRPDDPDARALLRELSLPPPDSARPDG